MCVCLQVYEYSMYVYVNASVHMYVCCRYCSCIHSYVHGYVLGDQ